jgi:hypothetical protein
MVPALLSLRPDLDFSYQLKNSCASEYTWSHYSVHKAYLKSTYSAHKAHFR